jgi:hypothetical protein
MSAMAACAISGSRRTSGHGGSSATQGRPSIWVRQGPDCLSPAGATQSGQTGAAGPAAEPPRRHRPGGASFTEEDSPGWPNPWRRQYPATGRAAPPSSVVWWRKPGGLPLAPDAAKLRVPPVEPQALADHGLSSGTDEAAVATRGAVRACRARARFLLLAPAGRRSCDQSQRRGQHRALPGSHRDLPSDPGVGTSPS